MLTLRRRGKSGNWYIRGTVTYGGRTIDVAEFSSGTGAGVRFVFADSLDFVDPAYDFIADRNGARRSILHDDQFPHEFLDEVPYDGILVSRGIVGDALMGGKYSEAQFMRFRREGARRFLRYPLDRYPDSMMMGDCGAFTYRNMPEPPYRAEDTVEFYADGGVEALIFRNSNRNKRRGMHNLHVFHNHLRDFRETAA